MCGSGLLVFLTWFCSILSDMLFCLFFFFLMIRRPPRSTRTDTLFPYTTLFRSSNAATLIVIGPARRLVHAGYESNHLRRSDEHTSALQSLMRISYAVFCLKKKTPFDGLHSGIYNGDAYEM